MTDSDDALVIEPPATATTRPRQADIARAAGVSVSTVSRVLANEPGISGEARDAVKKVAERLGYFRKGGQGAVARTHAGNLIAFLPVERATSELGTFYEGILTALRGASETAGSTLSVRLVNESAMTPAFVEAYIAAASAAGVFLIGLDPDPPVATALASMNTAVVLVNGADPEMRFDCVSPANFYGGRRATEELIAAGHRHIAHIAGEHRHTTRERARGFRHAVAAVEGGHAYQGEMTFKGHNAEEAGRLISILLDAHPEISAAFCMNDMIALGVVNAVEARGLAVPHDFSVIGFDDLPCASMVTPRLATLRVDREAIGREALRLMLERMARPEAEQRQVQFGVRFVPGGTVGPFRPKAGEAA